MLLTLFLACAVGLGVATTLLLAVGHRVRFAAPPLGVVLSLAIALVAGELARIVWQLQPGPVRGGEVLLAVLGAAVSLARPRWNPIGQAFFGAFLAAAGVYLAFGLYVTFGTSLSAPAAAASFVLFLMELFALLLAGSFTFESLDVLRRDRWPRPIPDLDPSP